MANRNRTRFGFAIMAGLALGVLHLNAFASDPKLRTFPGGMDRVFAAAVKAASQPGWTVEASDRAARTLQFSISFNAPANTSGVLCAASLQDADNGNVQISLSTQKRYGTVGAWARCERYGNVWFKKISAEIDKPK